MAQLSVGNASFWVSDESPMHGNFSPESLGGATVRMLLIVEHPEAVVERVTAAGATLVHPVGEEHGWRLGRIEDPFGHHWEIGKPLIAWPPAECGHAGEIQRFTVSPPPHCRSTIPSAPRPRLTVNPDDTHPRRGGRSDAVMRTRSGSQWEMLLV